MMLHRKILQRVIVIGVIWLGVSLANSPAQGQDWTNTSGGNWFDFGSPNWLHGNPTSGSSPRFVDSQATGTYTVTFAGASLGSQPTNYFNQSLQFFGTTSGVMDVTFDLNGFSPTIPAFGGAEGYAVSSSFFVGHSNRTGTLRLVNGTLTSGPIALIGVANATGELNVGSGATLKSLSGFQIGVGGSGNGTLRVTGGGTVDVVPVRTSAPHGIVGFNSTDTGRISVDGPGSSFTQTQGLLHVGRAGTGSINVTNGGSFVLDRMNADHLYLGRDSTVASGTIRVDGSGSTFDVTNTLSTRLQMFVGSAGTGLVEVLNGGAATVDLSVGIGTISSSASGSGNVLVDGTGSSFTVTNAGFDPSVTIGRISGSTGSLAVNNGGAVNVDGQVKVDGTGTLALDGGTLNAGGLFLNGGTVIGNGTVNAPVSGGSTITASGGTLSLGDSGSTSGFNFAGDLIVQNGAVVELLDADRAQLGAQTTLNNGVFIARNGALLDSGEAFSGFGVVVGDVTGAGDFAIANNPTGTVDLAFDFGNDTGVVYSAGPAGLGGSTVAGGTIVAATGIQLNNGESLLGFGSVDANVGLNGGILNSTSLTLAVNGAVNGNGLIVEAPGSAVTATGGFNVSGTLSLTGPLNVANNNATVLSQGLAGLGSSTTLAGGSLNAANGVSLGVLETITGNGAINGRFLGTAGSSITASGGNLEIGDAGSFVGFNHGGELHVDSNTVTLNSRGFASLGSLTTVTGGTLNAPNGFALGTGDVLVAGSSVNGRIAASLGSIIDATGDLNIGDATAFDGFFSDGVLSVNSHTVTINDANIGVLGSLTTIDGGTLAAANGLLLEAGKNIVGNGLISADLVTQGDIFVTSGILEFSGDVSGAGGFDGPGFVNFTGTFSPGNSPALITGNNMMFSGMLMMEIGGLLRGSEYDAFDLSGTAMLGGILEIDLIDAGTGGGLFNPSLGNSFLLIDAASIDGVFDTLDFSGAPLDTGLAWRIRYDIGAGDVFLSVVDVNAVPEPSSLALFGIGAIGLFGYGWRRKRKQTVA